MDDKLNLALKKIHTAYLAVWIAIVFSLFSNFLFQGSMNAYVVLGLHFISFWGSLGILIYAVFQALKLYKYLTESKLNGGLMILLSFVGMLAAQLLSLQTPFGTNAAVVIQIAVDDIFSNLSDIKWTYLGVASVIAMLIFMASQVMTFIGFFQLSEGKYQQYKALSDLKMLKYSALGLMIVTLVFSPIWLSYANTIGFTHQNPPYALDIVAAIFYLAGIGSFLYFLSKSGEWKIVDANDVKQPAKVYEIPINPSLKECLNYLGKSYMYVYVTAVVSAIIMFLFYYTESIILMILTLPAYLAGWAVAIFGIITALRTSNRLTGPLYQAGRIFVFAFIALVLTCFLSFNSIIGANVMNIFGPPLEAITEMFTFPEGKVLIPGFSGLAMISFSIFQILTLIGVCKLGRNVPEIRKAGIGVIILTAASVIFSPTLLCYLVLERDMSFIVAVLALAAYGIGAFLFLKPWANCQTVAYSQPVTNAETETDGTETPSSLKWDIPTMIDTIKKNQKLKIIVYGAIVSLLVLAYSFFTVGARIIRANSNSNELYEHLYENDDDDDDEEYVKPKTSKKQKPVVREKSERYDDYDRVETPRAESFDSAEEYFTNHTSDIASSYGDAHYDGFFYAGEKKFPISIYYFLTSDMSVISCRYTNVNYKTETNMDVTFNGSEMILRGLDGKNEFVMHFSPTSNGNWEGWAQSGKQRLRATLRPRR